jgi:uncharacterized protein with NRDE domain
MCTVTYIPQGEDHFILTSNRDENRARSPQNITATHSERQQLAFPRDTAAGGAWIAAGSRNQVVCLLNGAFTRHERRPSYRRSRGLMVLDFFAFDRAADFFSRYQFEGMEPFTMIIYDLDRLYDLRWDEEQKHIRELDGDAFHIWSSATLYTPEIQEKRVRWFEEWQSRQDDLPGRAQILDFHRTAGDGDPWNDVIMNRNGIVQTVSITSIEKTPAEIDMQYHDLINQQTKSTKIRLQGEVLGAR